MKQRSVLLMAMALVLASCGAPAAPRERPAPVVQASPQALRGAAAAFDRFRGGFVEWYQEAYPVRSSELGLRAHDAALPGMDRASIQARIDALLDWDEELRRIPIRLMRDEDRADYALAEFTIRSELLELEEVRRWARDPVEYTRVVARGLASVAERDAVPAAERAEAVGARAAAAPAVLAAARENVRRAPRLWTELALEETAGLLAYVEETLPSLLGAASAGAAPGLNDLAAALRSHAAWLETELLPASTGDFGLGRYLFARALLYEAHVDLGVPELERVHAERIARLQSDAERLAEEVDPGRSLSAILDSIAALRPAAEEVPEVARQLMGEARDWVARSGVVTLPAADPPEVEPLLAHEVLGGPALRPAGPFAGAGDAEYRVPVPGAAAGAPPSTPDLLGATLRRTYPGEYLVRLHQRALPTDVRRMLTPRTFVEGWGQYAEAMAFEQGFRAADPVARLEHVRRMLQDQALWDATLRLHVAGEPIDRVVEHFAELAHVDDAVARREVLRASREPVAFAGALIHLQLLELRQAYEAHLEDEDDAFTLQGFHDRVLELALPVPLATEVLVPSPPEQELPRRRSVRRIRI